MNAVLHYIYDPLCGWCYGAEPLVWAASKVDGLTLRLHAGGLWPQPTRLPDHMRRYIQQADARVGQMSGQPYGEPYLNGLLFDPELVLESRPVIAAVLAAQSLDPSKALPMLRAIQHAHYERGQHVVREATLREIAVELGLDAGAFAEALKTVPCRMGVSRPRPPNSPSGSTRRCARSRGRINRARCRPSPFST
jgi:putative protein-disulfide isomerase